MDTLETVLQLNVVDVDPQMALDTPDAVTSSKLGDALDSDSSEEGIHWQQNLRAAAWPTGEPDRALALSFFG